MSSIWKGIGLSAIAILVTLLGIELLFRGVTAFSHASQRRSDRPRVHFFAEKSLSTADYFYSETKPPHTYRIAVIGDSFTYGFGNLFDDAFPKRLERILNLNDTQTRVEVINLGVPGYSSENEVLAVRSALDRYKPDLVMVEITLNDPDTKVFRRDEKKDAKGSLVVSGGIFTYWKSLAYIVSRIKNTISVYQYKRYFQGLFEDEKTVRVFGNALGRMKAAAVRHNVPLVAVVFPLVTFPLDATYPFVHAHEVLQQVLRSKDIMSLDLFEAFRNMDSQRLQAEPWIDPHPNEIAHRIAAEAIYLWLRKHCLIPSESMVRYTAKKRIGPTKLKKRGPKACKKVADAPVSF